MKTEPFLSGKYGWDLGENNWKDGADENFKKFAYMLNGNVSGFVSSLPTTPTDGDAYFLSTDNTLNARVEGSWNKFPVPKGFTVTDKATGLKYEFNGSAFVATLNATDKTKLNGIATGATVNSTDAALRDRTTHTGVQAISTITSLQSSLDAKAPLDSPTFTGTVTAPTVVSTDNTAKVATTAFVKSQGYLTSSSAGLVTSVAARTGDVVLVKADVGLSNVDNTSDLNKPVSTATQGSLNAKADLVSPTFTGTVTLPSNTSIGTVSSVELGYLDGVTSSIQGQINSLSGASGAFAPINSPTFTGTVSGITKAMVGLGNVDNTSDTAKPVSTATQTALNLKQNSLSGTGFVKSTAGTISYDTNSYASTASPTFTGTVVLPSTTSIGSVSSTQIGYLVNTTSDIQSQLNTKASLTSPVFNTITINAPSGQASTTFQQGGVTNGRVYAGGGGGTDIVIESGRFITLNPTSSFLVNFSGVTKFGVDSAGVTTATDGSGIGNLNASNLLIGTVSDSRLPATMTGKSFTSDVNIAGNVIASGYIKASASLGFISDTYVLNAQNPIWRFGNASAFGLSYFQGSSGISGQDTIGIHFGTATAAGSPFKFSADGTLRATYLSGDGSLLTSLNASNITAGTLSAARLPFTYTNINTNSTVVQRDGSGSFSANVITATFSGDGSNLTSLNGSAISIGTVPRANLPTGNTSVAGILQVIDSVSSSSVTAAASPNSVRSAWLAADAANTLANNAVQKATPSQLFQSLGSVSGTVTVNAANGTHVLMTVVGAMTLVLASPSSTEVVAYTVEYTNGGTNVTHPTGTRWAGGTAPTLTASGTDIIVYTKAGTNAWRGYLSSKDNR